MDAKTTLSANLQQLRKQKNVTQQQAADAMELNFKSLASWEQGRAEPSINDLKKLATFYLVTIDELVAELPNQ